MSLMSVVPPRSRVTKASASLLHSPRLPLETGVPTTGGWGIGLIGHSPEDGGAFVVFMNLLLSTLEKLRP